MVKAKQCIQRKDLQRIEDDSDKLIKVKGRHIFKWRTWQTTQCHTKEIQMEIKKKSRSVSPVIKVMQIKSLF